MSNTHHSVVQLHRETRNCGACAQFRHCVGRGLPEQERDLLSRMQPALHLVRRGDFIYRAGDAYDGLTFVSTGCLKTVVPTVEGDEHIIAFHTMGSVAGLSGLATGRYGNDIVAVASGSICQLSSRHVEQLRNDDHRFADLLLRWSCAQARHAERLAISLTTKPAAARVAEFLLEMRENSQLSSRGDTTFDLPMSRVEIAHHLALAPETLSRTINALQKRGLAQLSRRRVEWLDAVALANVAEDGLDRCNVAPIPEVA